MLARFITLLAVALFCFAGMAMADTEGHAVAHVYVVVDPNISVGVITPNVDLATVQTGLIPGILTFRVDANVEQAAFCVGASDLYKGDDPTDPEVAPIPVDRESGVDIQPTDANPVQGGSYNADYEEPWTYELFNGWMTGYILFESSQAGYFSQDVYVTLNWTQDDPEKPQGEYSGWVGFWAFIGDL
jgi:hypothetical protein